jgi:hypothetical protein
LRRSSQPASDEKSKRAERFLSTRRTTHHSPTGLQIFFHISFAPSRSAAGGVRSLARSFSLSLLTLLKKLFIPVRHGRSHSLKASVNTFLMFAIRNGSHRSARAQRRFPDTHAIFFIYVCGGQSSSRRIKIIARGLPHLVQLLLTNLRSAPKGKFRSKKFKNIFNYCS